MSDRIRSLMWESQLDVEHDFENDSPDQFINPRLRKLRTPP